ncbi:TonB-dependent receptor [Pedobacter miscanthi]|jgi:TonB-dependent SusC/RagA subfamily outer membrane receptor|uniref:TonB-dependent receptor n=1 Tax=Pedobacter miscanthi TaxID=2259170 RepID=UPI00292D9DE4|nr:TonB-dependent receptor plug domain-containing protein [Pedobacter miscanthi]
MKTLFTFTLIMSISLAGFAQKADSIKASKITLRGVPASGNEPLVVIDGNKQYTRGISSLDLIGQENIESMTVLKDSLAMAKYGTEGLAGVIEITTKRNPLGAKSFITAPKKIDKSPLKEKVIGISARPLSPAIKDGNSNFTITKNGIKLKDGGKAPLYIIDGEEATGTEKLDKKRIQSIDVIKDAAGVSKYGEKGKNGVIIITTKKAKASPKKN